MEAIDHLSQPAARVRLPKFAAVSSQKNHGSSSFAPPTHLVDCVPLPQPTNVRLAVIVTVVVVIAIFVVDVLLLLVLDRVRRFGHLGFLHQEIEDLGLS